MNNERPIKIRAIGATGAVGLAYAAFAAWLDLTGAAEREGALGEVARLLLNPPPGLILFIVGFGLFALLVYQMNEAWVARNQIQREFDEKLAIATADYQARRADQALADALQDHYDHGLHHILNCQPLPETDKDFTAWRFEALEWRNRIRHTMQQGGCTRQEISHVMDLARYTVTILKIPHDPAMNEQFNMVAERLERLKKIMGHYTTKPIGPE